MVGGRQLIWSIQNMTATCGGKKRALPGYPREGLTEPIYFCCCLRSLDTAAIFPTSAWFAAPPVSHRALLGTSRTHSNCPSYIPIRTLPKKPHFRPSCYTLSSLLSFLHCFLIQPHEPGHTSRLIGRFDWHAIGLHDGRVIAGVSFAKFQRH